MSSASVPELVSTAYERNEDAPTQLSTLMWMSPDGHPRRVALERLLVDRDVGDGARRGSTSIWPWIGTVEAAERDRRGCRRVEAQRAAPILIDPLSLILPISMPQPIW